MLSNLENHAFVRKTVNELFFLSQTTLNPIDVKIEKCPLWKNVETTGFLKLGQKKP
jgi:hypothetical protein